jgi:catechol 2,3-dioxygenase-like lactoylglutathione lyase family enzyme
MGVLALDHVQLAMPTGEETRARSFYSGILGLPEKQKPPNLAAYGGAWFQRGSLNVHLSVDKNFIAARKAHPAFTVDDLDDVAVRLRDHGYPVILDDAIPGSRRLFTEDPFGNRIELIQDPSSTARPS